MDDSWLTTDGVLSDRTDAMSTRLEKDTLGELPVPQAALYGVQTERARRNFPISHQFPLAPFVDAVVWIKRAAALTNKETGRLEARLADAIVRAADEVLAGQHRDQFVVDPYQAGAGTSHNMNCNEVLANRANELLGGRRGEYSPIHPNDHVNMAQSTNDVIPTAIRLGALRLLPDLLAALDRLGAACSSPAAPTSRMRPRSASARSSPLTATPSSATVPAWPVPPTTCATSGSAGPPWAPGSTPSPATRS